MYRLQGREYVPALRTRDSELKAFENLTPEVRRLLLPVFELTRSRRSKTNSDGSVVKTVERLISLMGENPFIVDVTSLDSQANAETAAFLDPADSFRNWCNFVLMHLPETCIPVVHLSDPFDRSEFAAQRARLESKFRGIALRVPTEYDDAQHLAAALKSSPKIGCVVLLVDAGFVPQGSSASASKSCMQVAQLFAGLVDLVAPLTSSFPSSVTEASFGGGDAYGDFVLEEVTVSEVMKLVGVGATRIVHGDYGLVHPNDFEGTVTNWVPRVDVPLDTTGFYYRYRRPAGGYALAAALAVKDVKYKALPCWAHDMVAKAAAGDPEGRSPSFWISVRVNFHISRQVFRLNPQLAR